jgi:hypothetical protein
MTNLIVAFRNFSNGPKNRSDGEKSVKKVKVCIGNKGHLRREEYSYTTFLRVRIAHSQEEISFQSIQAEP